MTTFISITEAYKKAYIVAPDPTLLFNRISYNYYFIWFKKNQIKIHALLDFGIKVNTITPIHMAKLGFKVRSTNIKAQKIDSSTFKIFRMVLASF